MKTKIQKVTIAIISLAAIIGVIVNITSFNWILSVACLGAFILDFLIVKEIWNVPSTEWVGVVAVSSAVLAITAICGLIPLAVIFYPIGDNIFISIYGFTALWALWLTFTLTILHDGIPKGTLRWLIGSCYCFWTVLCLLTIGYFVPVLQTIGAGAFVIFFISFFIYGYQTMILKKN